MFDFEQQSYKIQRLSLLTTVLTFCSGKNDINIHALSWAHFSAADSKMIIVQTSLTYRHYANATPLLEEEKKKTLFFAEVEGCPICG